MKSFYPLKAETNGSEGIGNALTADEIKACDGIIVAADKNVEMARFDGKPVLIVPVTEGIRHPEELINKIKNGEAPIYHASADIKEAYQVKVLVEASISIMNGVKSYVTIRCCGWYHDCHLILSR